MERYRLRRLTDYQATPEAQWANADQNKRIEGALTIGYYDGDSGDIRYCRCMGVGQSETFIGNKATTYPKEVVSAAGYLQNINQTRWYLWDINILSLRVAQKITITIKYGEIIKTQELSFLAYDKGSGRKGFYAKNDIFDFKNLSGETVEVSISW